MKKMTESEYVAYHHFLKLMTPSDEAIRAMNERCVENFNEAVARADALADECEIRRVLADVFGHRSYCVTVERG